MARNRFFALHARTPCTALANGAFGNSGLVYNELLRRSHFGKRPAFGGRKSIGEALGINEFTVKRQLEHLEAAGAIVKTFASWGGRGIANVYRIVKNDISSVARSLPRFPARQKCSKKTTADTYPTDRFNNRPPDVSPQRGQTADTGPPPPLFEPQDTSETADWAAINQILALGGAMPESIP